MAEYVVEVERIIGKGYTAYQHGRPKEEIIRCRDCLYWEDEDYCLHWQTSKYEAPCTLPEDFCSYAEKRVE